MSIMLISPRQAAIVVRHVLRPCVKIFLRLGIDYRCLSDLLKGVYISVAESDPVFTNLKPSDSRLSLLTGIHRKDVRALRAAEADGEIAGAEPSTISKVIRRWRQTPSLMDSTGAPLPIPRLRNKEGIISFDDIVASVTRDFRARVVFDECMLQGLVQIDKRDMVHLTEKALSDGGRHGTNEPLFVQEIYAQGPLNAAEVYSATWQEPRATLWRCSEPTLTVDADRAFSAAAQVAAASAFDVITPALSGEARNQNASRSFSPKRDLYCGVYFFVMNRADADRIYRTTPLPAERRAATSRDGYPSGKPAIDWQAGFPDRREYKGDRRKALRDRRQHPGNGYGGRHSAR